MGSRRLSEAAHVVPAILPQDITGGAVAGDWVDVSKYRRVLILIQQGAWAGGTSAVTVNEATANDGTGSQAVAFDQKWEGTALTDDTLTSVAVSSNTFDLDTANEFHLIEIDPTHLTLSGGYKYINVALGTPGANSDFVSATYFLYDADMEQAPDKQPTTIA